MPPKPYYNLYIPIMVAWITSLITRTQLKPKPQSQKLRLWGGNSDRSSRARASMSPSMRAPILGLRDWGLGFRGLGFTGLGFRV